LLAAPKLHEHVRALVPPEGAWRHQIDGVGAGLGAHAARDAAPPTVPPGAVAGGRWWSPPSRLSEARPNAEGGPGSAVGPLPLASLVLIAALAAAAANQGGYYRTAQWSLALLLGAAVLLALRARPWSGQDTRFWPLWVSVALALWALIRAALAHDPGAALPTAALLAGVIGVVAVARRTSDVDTLAVAVLAVGAVVALTGWVGVAWRVSPWALEDQGLWRGATSLTYTNAAGALLAVLAMLALGRLVDRPAAPLSAALTCLLFLGVAASLSRGAALAATAGVVVLVASLGVRGVARAGFAPGLGAAIAAVGLIPSIPAHSPPRPLVAAVALAGGLTVAVGLPRLGAVRRPTTVLLAVVAVTALVALTTAGPGSEAIQAIGDRRLTVSSPDRTEALDAAMRLVASNPIAGVGPGQAVLSWVDSDGRTFVAKYAHNEYLQVLVELGVVGLALLVALLVGIAREVRAGRPGASSRPVWAGGVAGLVALATASAVDFLWHVPAVPLFGAVLIGITVSQHRKEHQ
jgi:O-antigen ligase